MTYVVIPLVIGKFVKFGDMRVFNSVFLPEVTDKEL